MPIAGGRQITVSATWTIMAVVQNPPNRSVEPPAPRFLSCAWTWDAGDLQRGQDPRDRGADNRQHRGVKITVVGFRPGLTQNGSASLWPE